jgi:hypothetical protein
MRHAKWVSLVCLTAPSAWACSEALSPRLWTAGVIIDPPNGPEAEFLLNPGAKPIPDPLPAGTTHCDLGVKGFRLHNTTVILGIDRSSVSYQALQVGQRVDVKRFPGNSIDADCPGRLTADSVLLK